MGYNNKGFTIVELMIAISVFATAMVLVMAGVIHISRQYQQTSNRIALEDASRSIHQQISQSIRFSKDVTPPQLSGSRMVFCVGSDKYVYGQTNIVNSTTYATQTEGLYMDKITTACDSTLSPNSKNLLPIGAKVAYFNFNSGTLTTVFIKAPQNGGDLIKDATSDPSNAGCDTTKFKREYCASTKYISTATGRVN